MHDVRFDRCIELLSCAKAGVRLRREPEQHAQLAPPPSPLKRHDRVSVYWADADTWFDGTYKTNRIEAADGGGQQRASCILYDATGLWAGCTPRQLTYWHCLDDEQWKNA